MPSPGLQVDDLSRRFGPRWVLTHVSFDVPAGEALLLLGANGSGKTTLLRCLASALRPHHGAIRLGGRDLWAERASVRSDVALLGHATRLYEDLSAFENLAVWASLAGARADRAVLDRVGLADTGDRPVRAFSAGMKRRLALAVALLKAPRLALFDEPFTSLDVEGRALMGTIIDEVRAAGATVVLCTHHPEIGARHCERAIRLEGGRVAWRGPAREASLVGVE
ncbi:MAG TPA: heme ABC exporter ATP-binding protein CcmA [Myxococcota bacterium]|nr:heme ABC exporter ATP-binding protein CcmA [Myxococcota bacterium]